MDCLSLSVSKLPSAEEFVEWFHYSFRGVRWRRDKVGWHFIDQKRLTTAGGFDGICVSNCIHVTFLKRFPCSTPSPPPLSQAVCTVFVLNHTLGHIQQRVILNVVCAHSKYCSTLRELIVYWDVTEYLFGVFHTEDHLSVVLSVFLSAFVCMNNYLGDEWWYFMFVYKNHIVSLSNYGKNWAFRSYFRIFQAINYFFEYKSLQFLI